MRWGEGARVFEPWTSCVGAERLAWPLGLRTPDVHDEDGQRRGMVLRPWDDGVSLRGEHHSGAFAVEDREAFCRGDSEIGFPLSDARVRSGDANSGALLARCAGQAR